MELPQITDEKFVNAMEEAVDLRGADWCYPVGLPGWTYKPDEICRYVRDDVSKCACLIGTALHLAGVSLAQLRTWEGHNPSDFFDLLGVSDQIAVAAEMAQGVQDRGGTWGSALEIFTQHIAMAKADA